MTRYEISEGIRKIAWSYVFIYFHINLGTIDILPDWWGYILILKGIDILKNDEPSIALLRPLGIIFTAYNILLWGIKIIGVRIDIYILDIITSVLLLYFNFQLLTNIADIAKRYSCKEEAKIRKLIIVRTIITALISAPIDIDGYEWVIILIAVTTLIIAIWTGILLFCLKESIMEGEESTE